MKKEKERNIKDETKIEKHKKYLDFEKLYHEYCNNLGVSTISNEERTEKIKTFLPSHKSGYDEGYAYYVFSLKENKTIRFQNVKNSLWHTASAREISKGEILENTHKSHRHIIAHLLHGVFSIFGKNKEYRENLYEKRCFLRIGRAFKDEENGSFWRVVQSIFPIDYDEEMNVLSYFSSIFIEDRYKNDVPFVNIVPNYLSVEPVSKNLLKEFQEHKYTILDFADFEPKQKKIICIIYEKLCAKLDDKSEINAEEIVEELNKRKTKKEKDDVKLTTVYKQSTKILQKGKRIFPLNKFKTVTEFVYFLKISDFIDENYSNFLSKST